jgi:hypothetical protein
VDEIIGDHLLEMFTPEDCRGTDGLLHEEVEPDLTCSCGLAAATPEEPMPLRSRCGAASAMPGT